MFTHLTEETGAQIDKIMADLLEQVEAQAVYLCERGGHIIVRQSIDPVPNEENIAALAAGSFFATLEMARLIGEREFKYVLHQGQKESIYMEAAPGDMLLVVVFSKDSNPGLVKLYARNACQELTRYSQMSQSLPMNFEMDENAEVFPIKPPQK